MVLDNQRARVLTMQTCAIADCGELEENLVFIGFQANNWGRNLSLDRMLAYVLTFFFWRLFGS